MNRENPTKSGSTPRHPASQIEMDHSQLDIHLIGNYGKLRGRPWMATLLDRYTQAIFDCLLSAAAKPEPSNDPAFDSDK